MQIRVRVVLRILLHNRQSFLINFAELLILPERDPSGALLTANGVPGDRIVTWNPNREDLPDGPPIDLAVSFLSCGFHYPIDMYMPFFELAVAPKGAVILDLRGGQADAMVDKLELLGRVRVLRQGGGIRQVLLKKQAGT